MRQVLGHRLLCGAQPLRLGLRDSRGHGTIGAARQWGPWDNGGHALGGANLERELLSVCTGDSHRTPGAAGLAQCLLKGQEEGVGDQVEQQDGGWGAGAESAGGGGVVGGCSGLWQCRLDAGTMTCSEASAARASTTRQPRRVHDRSPCRRRVYICREIHRKRDNGAVCCFHVSPNRNASSTF